MRFGSRGSQRGRKYGSRRPPPNYLSRSVQGRLFLLVAALMAVLIAMQEARDPRYYRIFEKLQEGQLEGGERIDTRVRSPDTWSAAGVGLPIVEAGPGGDGSVEAGLRSEPWAMTGTGPEVSTGEDPLELARRDGWAAVLDRLTSAEKSELLQAVRAARHGDTPAVEDPESWRATLEALDRCWGEYLEAASRSLEEKRETLSKPALETWREVLERLAGRWRDARAALRVLGTEQPPGDEHGQALAEMQAIWDVIFLGTIRDATVFRPGEADAWFRLLEKLQAAEQSALEQASLGPVSFLSLYRQPEEYRGKLVTVRGSVRQGKLVTAPSNVYGIERYYIVWLKPRGSRSPIVVYTLDLPDGFPLRDVPPGGAYVPAEEDVTVTGYFFKRWAYRAQDATRLAPLLLAKTLRWTPAAAEPEVPARLTTGRVAGLVAGTLLFGVGVSLVVYWTTRERSASRRDSVPAGRIGPAPGESD